MFYNTDFLPQVLAVICGAAALVVLLSLLVAVVPLPRRQHRQPPVTLGPRDHEAITPDTYHSHH